MTSSADREVPVEQLASAIGNVSVPGSIGQLAEAMTVPRQNVLRCRREIQVADLPVPTDPVPWYVLARRPLSHRRLSHGASSRKPAHDTLQPSRTLPYAAADFYLQDAGSLLALAACDADTSSVRDLVICDLCAAPGGKASALVEAVAGGGGFVLANETIHSRLGALGFNLARTGSDQYAISNLDPQSLADRLGGAFDLVLVDAPCSGQALLGRGKQNLSSLTSKQIEHSAARQRRILDAATRLLRKDGRLIYSTCTFAEAENESQALRLTSTGQLQTEPIPRLSCLGEDSQTSEGCYRLWPHRHDCAGSFAASMKRIEANQSVWKPVRKRRRDPPIPTDLTQWYGPLQTTRIYQRDSVVFGWPGEAPPWVEEVAVAGPELAHRVGQTWRPAHAAALRRGARSGDRASISVDAGLAQAYLRGEPIPTSRSGWHVVAWKGRPLGWIKGTGGHGKNHLPKAARVNCIGAG